MKIEGEVFSKCASGHTLTDRLHELLGAAIVGGRYAHRRFPTTLELSSEYGVGRSVAREAVKMLHAKGLLGMRPRQGTFLLPIESWSLFDADVLRWISLGSSSEDLLGSLGELRLGVEPQAAAMASRSASGFQLDAISHETARLVAAVYNEDEQIRARLAFHCAVMDGTNNAFYIQLRGVMALLFRADHVAEITSSRSYASLLAYEAVCRAIVNRKPEEAKFAMGELIMEERAAAML